MKEVGMKAIDEGVSLNQLIPLYQKYRIGFHVVDFKYHLTSSHHDYDYKPSTNYLRLFYMIEGNHLYPIINKQDQHALSQLKRKPYKVHKKNKDKDTSKRTVQVFYKPLDILCMLSLKKPDGHVYTHFNYDECKNDLFVCVCKETVHELFYELLKRGQLHNKNIKTVDGQIVQFDIGKMTIQENVNYYRVENTITTLNKELTSDFYYYQGQSLHTLAHQVYDRKYDTNYMSQLSPQVAKIFNDKSSKNTAFNITLKPVQATKAYDFNKLYSYILQCCNNDKFGWSQYSPVDEVEVFDGKITTGIYFIKCNDCFPFHGNGWYSDAFVYDALNLNLIDDDDILYQIKASTKLPYWFFQDFINYVSQNFDNYKLANNGFIGLLAKDYTTYEKYYFTQDRMMALKEWLKNPDEVSFSGIYDNSKDLNHYKFMMCNDNLQAMIDLAKNETIDPMVWMVNISKKTRLYKNALPIHRKIYDTANMMVYKKNIYKLCH